MKKTLISQAALSALGVVAYIAFIVWLISHLSTIVESTNKGILQPMLFLLLFVVSASITGSLVFGRPMYLFFSGAKKDAVMLAVSTIAMLVIVGIFVFVAILTTQVL